MASCLHSDQIIVNLQGVFTNEWKQAQRDFVVIYNFVKNNQKLE